MPSQFTCPVCGSHYFGSSANADGTRTYNCQEGPRGPCLFSVHEKSAARYGIAVCGVAVGTQGHSGVR